MPSSSTPFKVGFAALLAHSLIAHAAFQVTDNSELFLNAGTAIRADDNIYQTKDNAVDDVIFQFSPGLEFKAGKEGSTFGKISYTQDFIVYADNDDNNASLADIKALGSVATARSKVDADVYFQQLEGNTNDFLGSSFGDLVKRDTYGGSFRAETEATPKISVATGVDVDITDYENAILIDQLRSAIPVNVYYRFLPKLDLSAGYEYVTRSLGDSVLNSVTTRHLGDSSHFFNVGARGELAPKLTSSVRIGVESRNPRSAGLDDETTLAVDGTLAWAATPKSNYELRASRRFETSGSGVGYTRSELGLTSTYSLTDELGVNAGLRYERSEYGTGNRDDDYYEASIGAGYIVNQHVTLSAGYVYRFVNSTVSAVEFDNNIVSVSASFRY